MFYKVIIIYYVRHSKKFCAGNTTVDEMKIGPHILYSLCMISYTSAFIKET